MHELDRFLLGGLPVGDAAAFFMQIKYAGAGDPPDETGVLEGQFSVPVEQALSIMSELVRNEFETQYAYQVYAQALRDLSHDSIAEHFQAHADEELGHAEFLLKRMAVLGGPIHVPDLKAPIASSDPIQIIKTMIRMEQEGIAGWRKLLAVVGENPMRVKIEDYMAAEQEHLDDLWQLLPHVERKAVLTEVRKTASALPYVAAAAIPAAFATAATLAAVGPEGRKRMNEEIHDPRLYSNLRGMATLESAEERVGAHKKLDRSKDHSVLSAMAEGFSRKGKEAAEDPEVAGKRRALTNMAAQVEADQLSRGEDIGDIAGRGLGAIIGGTAMRQHPGLPMLGGVLAGQHLGGITGKAIGRAIDDARFRNQAFEQQLAGMEGKQAEVDPALIGRLQSMDPRQAYEDYLASKGYGGGALGTGLGATGGALAGAALGHMVRHPLLGATVGGVLGGNAGGRIGTNIARNRAFEEIANANVPMGVGESVGLPSDMKAAEAVEQNPNEVAGFDIAAKPPAAPENSILKTIKKIVAPTRVPDGPQQGMGVGQTFQKKATVGAMLKRAFEDMGGLADAQSVRSTPAVDPANTQVPSAVPPQVAGVVPNAVPTPHVDVLRYLQTVMSDELSSRKAEADYYKQQAGSAQQQAEMSGQQLQQATQQVQQLQQQAEQAQQQLGQALQQSQMVQDQSMQSAMMANQIASKAQTDHIQAMQEAMLHKSLSANMRAGVIGMKQQVGQALQQIQQSLASDPTEGIEQQISPSAVSMGPTEVAAPDQAVAAQPAPGSPSTEGVDAQQASQPAQQGESQAATQTSMKEGSVKDVANQTLSSFWGDVKRHAPFMVPGAIAGGSYMALGSGGFAEPLEKELAERQAAREGRDPSFKESAGDAQLKLRHLVADLADRYPVQMSLVGASAGANVAKNLGDAGRYLVEHASKLKP